MEVISGLVVVVVFMVIAAIAIGAVGERYDKRSKDMVDTENHYFN